MTTTETADSIALSSVDGKDWWNTYLPFPYPEAPAPEVKRIVLGSLEDDQTIELDSETLAGLQQIGSHFPELTHLHLWGITNLESVNGLPATLECIDIRKCPRLTSIGPVGNAIETLDLADCTKLTALPTGIENNRLKQVWLENSRSIELFCPIKPSLRSLETLVLHGCEFKDLKTAHCGEQTGQNVIRKVKELLLNTQLTEALAECKIVVLGNGGVGKTELVRALQGYRFVDDQTSTEGIFLWKWNGSPTPGGQPFAPFPNFNVNSVDLNIWDFGGQDLYHNTHRLFLESDAIFVIVWRQPKRDETGKLIPFRTGKEFENDPIRPLRYWVDQVKAVRPSAKLLIVRTGKDEDEQHPPNDWQKELDSLADEEKQWVFETSSKHPTEYELDQFRSQLLDQVKVELRDPKSLHMPVGYVRLREKLSEWQPAWKEGDQTFVLSEKPLMSFKEFKDAYIEELEKIGEPTGTNESIETIVEIFHDLGVVYYPKNWIDQLKQKQDIPIIVDQRWVIEGIYELFRQQSSYLSLIACRGKVTQTFFPKLWDRAGHNYSDQAKNAMTQFMISCGMLFRLDQSTYILPEFLLDEAEIEAEADSNPLIEQTIAKSTTKRDYYLKDRSLGRGFGCLLVAFLSNNFGRSPLFRYGAVTKMTIGNHFTDGGPKDILIKVGWIQENKDLFHGNIIVTIYDECGVDIDQQILNDLYEKMKLQIPAFPSNEKFAGLPSTLPKFETHDRVSMESRVSPKKYEGRIGISMAGGEELEFWPNALRRNLIRKLPDTIEVVCYRSDIKRPTISDLIHDLVTSQLMIAFISAKYLYSEWCMVELFEAAKHCKPDSTFEKPRTWINRVWPVVLEDVQDAELDRNNEAAKEIWINNWVKTGAEFEKSKKITHGGEKAAIANGPNEEVYFSWMWEGCRESNDLRNILKSIEEARQTTSCFNPTKSPYTDNQKTKNWADRQIAPLVDRIIIQFNSLTEES